MPDLTKLSDEELYQLANISPSQQTDVTKMSDEELFELVEQQQIPQQQDIRATKMIPQFTKGLYESLPFGKRVISMLPKAEQVEQTMETTPRPQGFLPQFARGLGAISPDLAMSAPFMQGARYIPKVSQIAKTALGFGAYGGTKAAIQRQPIIPSALSSAGSAALFHGAGRLGATAIPRFIPGAERIGSALGGGLAGKMVGGEESMALGAGLGALYPATRIQPTAQTTKMAESLINYVLKPSKTLKKYTSPARAIVKESLWGKNMADLESKVENRLSELNQHKDQLKTDAKNLGVRIDIKNSLKPVYDLLVNLEKAPTSHRTEINAINRYIKDINTRFPNKANLSLDETYEIRDIIKGLSPLQPFTKQSHAEISNALRETYHNIVQSIIDTKGVSPDLKLTNKRIADLISAKSAIEDASSRNPSFWRFAPIPMLFGGLAGKIAGGPLGVMVGLGIAGAETPIGATTISKIIGQKYPKLRK